MPKRETDKKITFDRLLKLIGKPSNRVHFIGIGGVSMYSLARITLLTSSKVSGSDLVETERVRELVSLGASVSIGHNRDNIEGAALVVYTSAVSEDNPELIGALSLGIPTVSRAEYMGALMISYKNRIGISGSHGKSTTVAMLDRIFTEALCEPTVLSGSDLPMGEPFKLGERSLLLYEACEYKDSFLKFSPTIAVALNLELDHTDYFDGIKSLKRSFVKALGKATKCAIINLDDENLASVRRKLKNKVVTFGQGERADYRYRITSFLECGYEFTIEKFGSVIGKFRLNIPGVFNVANATAAIVTAIEFGINLDVIASAISSYKGIARRLEHIGERYGRPVYYDYAHHPTEIRCSINALKMLTHDLITVIFKPHTYTRTKNLWEDFILALSLADYVVLTDIYPAREEPIEGISSERLAAAMGSKAIYALDSAVSAVIDRQTHGTIIIMGAGEFDTVKRDILLK